MSAASSVPSSFKTMTDLDLLTARTTSMSDYRGEVQQTLDASFDQYGVETGHTTQVQSPIQVDHGPASPSSVPVVDLADDGGEEEVEAAAAATDADGDAKMTGGGGAKAEAEAEAGEEAEAPTPTPKKRTANGDSKRSKKKSKKGEAYIRSLEEQVEMMRKEMDKMKRAMAKPKATRKATGRAKFLDDEASEADSANERSENRIERAGTDAKSAKDDAKLTENPDKHEKYGPRDDSQDEGSTDHENFVNDVLDSDDQIKIERTRKNAARLPGGTDGDITSSDDDDDDDDDVDELHDTTSAAAANEKETREARMKKGRQAQALQDMKMKKGRQAKALQSLKSRRALEAAQEQAEAAAAFGGSLDSDGRDGRAAAVTAQAHVQRNRALQAVKPVKTPDGAVDLSGVEETHANFISNPKAWPAWLELAQMVANKTSTVGGCASAGGTLYTEDDLADMTKHLLLLAHTLLTPRTTDASFLDMMVILNNLPQSVTAASSQIMHKFNKSLQKAASTSEVHRFIAATLFFGTTSDYMLLEEGTVPETTKEMNCVWSNQPIKAGEKVDKIIFFVTKPGEKAWNVRVFYLKQHPKNPHLYAQIICACVNYVMWPAVFARRIIKWQADAKIPVTLQGPMRMHQFLNTDDAVKAAADALACHFMARHIATGHMVNLTGA